jgi:hypothetical protein
MVGRRCRLAMKKSILTMAMGAVALSVVTIVAFAVTPSHGGTVGGSTIAVDISAGDQLDPHVSGDWSAHLSAHSKWETHHEVN